MRAKRICITFLLLFVFLVRAIPSTPQEGWLGFASYPEARHVCENWVLGSANGRRVEVHWHSFATTDAPDQVAAFYAKKERVPAEKDKDDGSLIFRHGKNYVLIIFSVSAHYQTCDHETVRAEEKTVISVSQMLR